MFVPVVAASELASDTILVPNVGPLPQTLAAKPTRTLQLLS